MWRPLFRFLIGLDQALNPLILGGSEDVTLSAQLAYFELMHGSHVRARKFLDFITRPFHDLHCYRSLAGEIDEFPNEREQLIEMLRERGVEV